MRADGSFTVAWETVDTSGEAVALRHFAADGTPAGPELRAHTLVVGAQEDPGVALDDAGRLAVTWASDTSLGSDASLASIQARRFDVAIFADGFESADTTCWSSTVAVP